MYAKCTCLDYIQNLFPKNFRSWSKTLNEFRKGVFQVLLSSDALTRVMDVEGVRNVINYDVPKFIKTYVHRAGRTARAVQTGRCFTLMSEDEANDYCNFEWGSLIGTWYPLITQ
ncbi:helicase family carboxy-terminal domain protein [Medicago truncatula]|uniref:Helicase family carboxy-terminal domain protein n=1 Tax=Medicago truncatula TaxID=3880 RepID=A0A072TSW5_MEDTR|nr:helicase family carboxy-terminal domain protein [Medicago truncatula]